MLTTQQAKLKQLKRVQLLKSQTQQNAELVAQLHQKELSDTMRADEVQARMQRQKADREAHEADVEVGSCCKSSLLSLRAKEQTCNPPTLCQHSFLESLLGFALHLP